jgi:hypothetical protein
MRLSIVYTSTHAVFYAKFSDNQSIHINRNAPIGFFAPLIFQKASPPQKELRTVRYTSGLLPLSLLLWLTFLFSLFWCRLLALPYARFCKDPGFVNARYSSTFLNGDRSGWIDGIRCLWGMRHACMHLISVRHGATYMMMPSKKYSHVILIHLRS